MRVDGTFENFNFHMNDILVTFRIPRMQADELNGLSGKQLVITAEEPEETYSDQARKYFWTLCGKIAMKKGNAKYNQYLEQLASYGVFQDVDVITDGIRILRKSFRDVEILYTYVGDDLQERNCVRCYLGISKYTKKQLQALIEGTVYDAKECGIETMTPMEIAIMLNAWKGEK